MASNTTLSAITLAAQQRSDQVNSNFLSASEWTYNVNASIQELYDLLIQKFGNLYYFATPSTFVTDGTSQQYSLPSNFYKLYGVDLQLFGAPNLTSFITLKRFPFGERNKYAIPNYQTYFGVTNLQYAITGNKLFFIPIPAANQTIQVWYAPAFTPLVNPTDTFDGINGYEEYVVTDAAIKAMQKEESDTSVLERQKMALIKRIEEAAENRDVGSPSTITDVNWSNFGWPGTGYAGGGSW